MNIHDRALSRPSATHLSIDFEPHVTLSATFHNGANGHEADNEGLTLLDGDVHFFADVGTAKEVASGDNAV